MKYYYLLKTKPNEELANMKLESFNFSNNVLYELHRAKIYRDGKFVPKIQTIGDLINLHEDGLHKYLKSNGLDLDTRDAIIQEVNEKLARVGLKFADNDFAVGDCRLSCLNLPPKVLDSIKQLKRNPKTFDDLLIMGMHRLESHLSFYYLQSINKQLEKYGLKIEGSNYVLNPKNFFTLDEFKTKNAPKKKQKDEIKALSDKKKPTFVPYEQLKNLTKEEILRQPIEALRLYRSNIDNLHDLEIFTIGDLVENANKVKRSVADFHTYYGYYTKLKPLGIGFGYDSDMMKVTYKNGKTMISYALTSSAPQPFDVKAASEEKQKEFLSTPIKNFGFCSDVVSYLPASCKTIEDLLNMTPKQLEEATIGGHRIRQRVVSAMHLYNLSLKRESSGKKALMPAKKPYIKIDLKTADAEQTATFMQTKLYDAGLSDTTSKLLAKRGIETVSDLLKQDYFGLSRTLNTSSINAIKRFANNYGLDINKSIDFESLDEEGKKKILDTPLMDLGVGVGVITKLVEGGYGNKVGSVSDVTYLQLEKNCSRSVAFTVVFALKKVGITLKKDKPAKSTENKLKNVYPNPPIETSEKTKEEKRKKFVEPQKKKPMRKTQKLKKVIKAPKEKTTDRGKRAKLWKHPTIEPKPIYIMNESEKNEFNSTSLSTIGFTRCTVEKLQAEGVTTIGELLQRDTDFIYKYIPASTLPKAKQFFEMYSIPLNKRNGLESYKFAIEEKPFESFSNEEKKMFINAKLSDIGMGSEKVGTLQSMGVETIGDLLNNNIYDIRKMVSKETILKLENFFNAYGIEIKPSNSNLAGRTQEEILNSSIESLKFEPDVVENLKKSNVRTIGDLTRISSRAFVKVVNKNKVHDGILTDAKALLASLNLSFASSDDKLRLPFEVKPFKKMTEQERQAFLNFKLEDIEHAGYPINFTLPSHGIQTIGDVIRCNSTEISLHLTHKMFDKFSELLDEYDVKISRGRRLIKYDFFEKHKTPVEEMTDEEKREFFQTPIMDVGFAKHAKSKFDNLKISTIADLFTMRKKEMREQFGDTTKTYALIKKLDNVFGIRKAIAPEEQNEETQVEKAQTLKISELENGLRENGLSKLFEVPSSCFADNDDLAEIVDIVDDYIDERVGDKEDLRKELKNLADNIISARQSAFGSNTKTNRYKRYKQENKLENIILDGKIVHHFSKPTKEDEFDFENSL